MGLAFGVGEVSRVTFRLRATWRGLGREWVFLGGPLALSLSHLWAWYCRPSRLAAGVTWSGIAGKLLVLGRPRREAVPISAVMGPIKRPQSAGQGGLSRALSWGAKKPQDV